MESEPEQFSRWRKVVEDIFRSGNSCQIAAKLLLLLTFLLFVAGGSLLPSQFASSAWLLIAPGVLSGILSLYLFWRCRSRAKSLELKGANPFGPDEGKFLEGLGHRDELAELKATVGSGQIAVIIVHGENGVGKTSLVNATLRNYLEEEGHHCAYVNASKDDFHVTLDSIDAVAGFEEKKSLIILDNVDLASDVERIRELVHSALIETPRPQYMRILILITSTEDYEALWHKEEWSGHDALRPVLVKPFPSHEVPAIAKKMVTGAKVSRQALNSIVDDIVEDSKVSALKLSVVLKEVDQKAKPFKLKDFSSLGYADGIIVGYIRDNLLLYSDAQRKEFLEKLALRAASPRAAFTSEDLEVAQMDPADVGRLMRDLSSSSVRILKTFRDRNSFRIVEDWLSAVSALGDPLGPDVAVSKNHVQRKFRAWESAGHRRGGLLPRYDLAKARGLRDHLDPQISEYVKRSSIYRRLVGVAVLVPLVVVGLSAFLIPAAHSWLMSRRSEHYWGLPRDLADYREQIKELSLVGSERNSNLRGIPPGLTHLGLSGSRVSSLKGAPASIVDLNIGDSYITSLSVLKEVPFHHLENLGARGIDVPDMLQIPRTVTKLTLGHANIGDVAGLPNGLVELDLRGSQVKSLNTLPQSLSRLVFYQKGFEINRLPVSLEFLETDTLVTQSLKAPSPLLDHLVLLGTPSYVPGTVTQLELGNAQVLGERPKNLRLLKFHDRLSYENWGAALPSCLQHLKIELREGESFGLAPRQLISLDLSNSHIRSIEGLKEVVPDLVELNVSSINDDPNNPVDGLLSLTGAPEKVKVLRFELCSATHLSSFPPKLINLYLGKCSNLTSIANLPPTLEELEVQGTSLRSIGGLDRLKKLRRLNISNTKIFERLPVLPPSLEELTLNEGQIKTLAGLPNSVTKLRFVDSEPNH